jgi:hypothetical protein
MSVAVTNFMDTRLSVFTITSTSQANVPAMLFLQIV